jgi:hypothetical protein
MKPTRVKPISYVKANAADLIRELKETEETLALLKILALGRRQVEEGRTVSADEAFSSLRKRSRRSSTGSRATMDPAGRSTCSSASRRRSKR